MQYDHILIRYGELGLKGKNIHRFLARLQRNIEQKLTAFPEVKVKRTMGRIYVLLNGHDPEQIINICKNIFGIYSLSLALRVKNDLEAIKEAALFALQNSEDAKTFKVSARRVDKSFPTGSQEMNQILGAHLLKNTSDFVVDVHEPDVEVQVEVRNEGTFIMSQVIKGLGGLPVGTGGKTLLLLSGGIDSPVAGYLAMKRGVQVEAIHFHSPPFTSERAKQKVIDIAHKLTRYGHNIRIHLVPFTEIQQKIFKDLPEAYAMTIMRRVMLQISEQVCQHRSILSMTTGESLGQVASQTMESMNVINEVTNYPVLRPLIAMDKAEIIDVSKAIDTYEISIRPYEDCCTVFVPKSPKTNPKRDKVREIEAKVDLTPYIERAIKDIEQITISAEESPQNSFDYLL